MELGITGDNDRSSTNLSLFKFLQIKKESHTTYNNMRNKSKNLIENKIAETDYIDTVICIITHSPCLVQTLQ